MTGYSDEMFSANHITKYIHSIIVKTIQKFSLLLPGNLKRMGPNLEDLEAWTISSTDDINSKILELVSK